ncbi:hypothetical protein GCM10023081_13780 [Arthrobacter ginkgonis]|uniref:Class II aldolase/adducin N-terminal domain-containing protein n=1 Tax=Arthrobacter ginkgonis TaxID=1630594 RepID=A0ABP7C413_9MICC
MSDAATIGQVVDAHRALAAAGAGDLVWGHMAIRDPAGRGVWTKAAGWGMEDLCPERVVLVSFDGAVIAGDGERHLEVFIHTELMRRRPEVRASVHTHGEAAVAFASLEEPLRPISHAATPFLEPGRDVPRFERTGNLIRTPELGAALAARIGSGAGCLIPAHGLVTAGADAAHAVLNAVLLERACSTQLAALAAGGPRRWSSEAEAAAKKAEIWSAEGVRAAYGHLVRRADATIPRPAAGAPARPDTKEIPA